MLILLPWTDHWHSTLIRKRIVLANSQSKHHPCLRTRILTTTPGSCIYLTLILYQKGKIPDLHIEGMTNMSKLIDYRARPKVHSKQTELAEVTDSVRILVCLSTSPMVFRLYQKHFH